MTLPSLEQAEQLWQEGYDLRCATTPFRDKEEYIFHTKGVAKAAEMIAAQTTDMNPQKAYIIGLLHDYGKKYDERATGIFHGKSGFEEMMDKGYNEVAKICLTHSFLVKDFEDIYYSAYSKDSLAWAHAELAKIEYDDYDRLIQLCDMFFEGMNMVSFEERVAGIVRRYHLAPEVVDYICSNSERNKRYFDAKCGCDIYHLLKIKPYTKDN